MSNTSMRSILTALKHDPIRYVSMINLIENRPEIILSCENIDGTIVMRVGNPIRTYVAVTGELRPDVIQHMLTDNDTTFFCIEERLIPIVTNDRHATHVTTLMLGYIPSDFVVSPPDVAVAPLNPSHAEMVNDCWEFKGEGTLHYIRTQIETEMSGVIIIDGNPAAWILTHDDGAIGMLYVKEAFRGRGFGHILTQSMVAAIQKRGDTPFEYVVAGQHVPLAIWKKLGFCHFCDLAIVRVR